MDNRQTHRVNNFLGMMSNADPHDIPQGAFRFQQNLVVKKAGQLNVRNAFAPAIGTRSDTDRIITVFRYDAPNGTHFVYQTVTGKILARKADTTVVTLGTGYSGSHCICFQKTRQGILLGFNGIDDPFRWDGYKTTLEPAGIDAPAVAPTMSIIASGGLLSIGFYGTAYRYLDDSTIFDEFFDGTKGPYPSSFSPRTNTEITVANSKLAWSALSSTTQVRVKKVEFWRTESSADPDALNTFFRLQFTGVATQTYIAYQGTVSTCVTNAGKCRFTTPSGHGLVVGAVFTMSGNSEATYNVSHTVTAVTATTIDTTVNYASAGGSATWILTGYINDTVSDETLETYRNTQLYTPNGNEDVALRFTRPPNYFRAMAIHQDRGFLAGHAVYSDGTLATNGTTTITGTSTTFRTTFIGRFIYIAGESRSYQITAVNSATEIVVNTAVANTASGLTYEIKPDPATANEIRYTAEDEMESWSVSNSLLIQENHESPDSIVGLAPNNNSLIVAQNAHIYTIRYVSQPVIDATPNMIANRGLINNRCWTRYENKLFMVDRFGAYFLSGDSVQEIDDSVADYWKSGTITLDNLAITEYYFVSNYRNADCVRFHFSLSTTDNNYPQYWLEFNTRINASYLGFYPPAICGFASNNVLATSIYYGGMNALVLSQSTNGNTYDGTTHFTGTATASSGTTLSDSTASFTTAVLDYPITITSGTGKFQTRYITARTSTQVTVNRAWDTNPDTTSIYSIGGIPWSFKTGILKLSSSQEATFEGVDIAFEPTTNAASLDIRHYYDHNATVVNNTNDYNLGANVTTEIGSPDSVVNMKSSVSAEYSQSGFVSHRLGGHRLDPMQSTKWISLEMRGVQTQDFVTLYEIGLISVSKGE